MDWFKAHSDGILRGSMAEAGDELQLIWIKLLALESETHYRDGCLRFCRGKPYSLAYIAEMCRKPVSAIKRAIKAFEADINEVTGTARVSYDEDGSIRLNNWVKYQGGKDKQMQKRNNEEQTLLGKEINQASFVKHTLDSAIAKAKAINPIIAEEYLDQKCKPTTKELRDMNKAAKLNASAKIDR